MLCHGSCKVVAPVEEPRWAADEAWRGSDGTLEQVVESHLQVQKQRRLS